jgi:hypothetical protein
LIFKSGAKLNKRLIKNKQRGSFLEIFFLRSFSALVIRW